MFKGHYVNTINDKGRLSIPSRFREVLDGDNLVHVVLTKGLDTCLTAYPPHEWELTEQRVARMSSGNKVALMYKRHVVGSAEECQIDAQGRILIPASLRDYAGLKKKCLLVGITDRFEIWDQETYDAFMKEALAALDDSQDLQNILAEHGL